MSQSHVAIVKPLRQRQVGNLRGERWTKSDSPHVFFIAISSKHFNLTPNIDILTPMKESFNPGPEFIEVKYPDTADNKRLRHPVTKRFERIMNNPKASEKLEGLLLDNFVIDVADEDLLLHLAKSLYESEKRVAIERGHGGDLEKMTLSDAEILEKYKAAILEKIEIQKNTLKSWFNYLKESEDYPMWFKYYVVRSLKSIGQFSRDEKNYANRTEDTVAPFPEMNAESLGFVYKALEHEFEKEGFNPDIGEVTLTDEEVGEVRSKIPADKLDQVFEPALKGRLRNKKRETLIQASDSFVKEKDETFTNDLPFNEERKEELTAEFLERLKTKDFAKLYAFAQVECAGNLDRESLEGEWVKYDKGSDFTLLENGLKGKGTGWCTAEGSAKGQIEQGDFYVFYTKNQAGIPTEPRIAIRMQGDTIAEIRGVNKRQELEPELVDTAKEKYKDLPGAEKYEKADADMKKMTGIYKKSFSVNKDTQEKKYLNPKLTKEELHFLYELDSKIKGFGYDKDPRVEETRSQRNVSQDMSVIFECEQEQIATDVNEVDENTKAYVGSWSVGVYNKIKDFPNISHLYESFPDKKIFIYELKTDASIQSSEQAKEKLESQGIFISDYGKDLLDKTEYSKEQKQYKLVQFTVGQLGFPQGATTDQIYAKAEELGLKLCPAEVGPQLRLSYSGKDWKPIAMKQISGRRGNPLVFSLYSGVSGLKLNANYADPSDEWHSDCQFVFLAS